jgi:monoterpene epsilon-lactone hydrolase
MLTVTLRKKIFMPWKFFLFLSFWLLKRTKYSLKCLHFIRRAVQFFDKLILFPKGYTLRKKIFGGTKVEIVEKLGNRSKAYIFYLHGGGFLLGLNNLYRNFATLLAETCEASVILVDYSLAPEQPFPTALEESFVAYKAFLEKYNPSEQVVMAGDSAGGNLAISTLLLCRENNIPQPSCAFIFSGWLDLTLKGKSLNENQKIDPILNANHLSDVVACYLGKREKPRHPLVSPLYARLQGLPPLFLHVGENEILLDDTLDFARKAQKHGVKVKIEIGEKMIHIQPVLFYQDTKSKQILDKMASFIKDNQIIGLIRD